jgi:hypothetical protein
MLRQVFENVALNFADMTIRVDHFPIGHFEPPLPRIELGYSSGQDARTPSSEFILFFSLRPLRPFDLAQGMLCGRYTI